ncbi:hypothetical protein [Sinorhizobium meliloti]|uniref:hypothetical protein n=1 Tax=Rhizobium meliloti TaxID=382 RepID=UPI000FE0D99A|nr:hypothetical protein [Sinorhizobium meliloti]MDX1216314.1 hypothetical protein [Sinorhizobium medicae]RVG70908.1 hypothetical protein CN222_01865 [Sinorhizobium meliloti]
MSQVPAHLDILSPEDVLAAIHHTSTTVTVRGLTFKVRAPTITELCELLARFPDLLELLDGSKEEPADKGDAILHLCRRAPAAVAAFSACAMDRPGNIDFERALLSKPDDFRIDLAAAAAEALFREHGTLQSFFAKTVQRLQDLGLTNVSSIILRILDSMSTAEEPKLQSAKARKTAGRKAA